MAVKKRTIGMNVLEAARMRIKNIFSNGCKVYLSVSGGKDSIVMSDLVYNLCVSGEVDKSLLEVQFVDEEVIYDEVVRICELWRKKFMMIGVKYTWFCVEHRNNNAFNALENNENFIPWDRFERANWARPMPSFAVESNRFLRPRVENYQDFLQRMNADGIAIIGVRAAESLNRLQYLATIGSQGGISGKGTMYPIYDWKDSDVWKYIKDNNVDFPDVYLKMYEAGIPKARLRVCNFMAIDSCASLTAMAEVYPDLWEKVLRREPNAYLVRLYWDTEMFHRQTKKRKELEGEADDVDYRKKLIEVLNHPDRYFKSKHAISLCKDVRRMIMRESVRVKPKHYRKLYECLMAGDTKGRTFRAIWTNIWIESEHEE